MPRRRKSGKRQRKGGRSSSNGMFSVVLPIASFIDEGKEVLITFDKLLYATSEVPKTDIFRGVPWRLTHIKISACLFNANDTDPALLQVGLCDASTPNVENVNSLRFIVNIIPTTRIIRTPSPNLWKEDESRKQALIRLDNFSFGSGTITSRVFFHIEAHIQFKRIPWSLPPKISMGIFQSEPGGSSGSGSPWSAV